jgi:predicted ATPase/DNA-binding SARP family transcriptional activator
LLNEPAPIRGYRRFVRIHLLGPVTATDGGRGVDLGGRRQRTVLAVLAAHAGRPVSTERLADELWGESPPESAANTVQSYVSRLRGLLGEGSIASTRSGYVLRHSDIDAREFEELVHRSEPGERAERLHHALDLWAGMPFEDVDDTPSIQAERIRLEELRTIALERWADVKLEGGHGNEVILVLEAEAERHPFREGLWMRLIAALAAAGRRADALDAYRRVRTALATELGIEPSRQLQELEEWVLIGDVAGPAQVLAPVPRRRADRPLPAPLTSFVGRRHELEQLLAEIERSRLVTLTGVGGSGKTRLALEAAGRLADRFEDGVAWIELEDVSDSDLVVDSIADALGLAAPPDQVSPMSRPPHVAAPTLSRLEMALSDRHVLLVVDTCDHLVESVARTFEPLLNSCPSLWVLATSREPLGMMGEVVWEVPALGTSASDSGHDDAIELFVERARAVRPDFRLDSSNERIVFEICRRLEGMPLAIELAAARLRVFELGEIADRLDDRLGFLAGSRSARRRQESLRATLDWSHALLSKAEKLLFGRLSVFRGFSLEAAEQVASADPLSPERTAGLLGSLVEKSMVSTEPTGESRRFRMLDTLREYAEEHLVRDELNRLKSAHLDYVTGMAEKCAEELIGPDQVAASRRLDAEQGNVRAALEWSIEQGHVERGLRLAMAMAGYWSVRGRVGEANEWFSRVLSTPIGEPTAQLARALALAATFAGQAEERASAERHIDEALAMAERLGDERALAVAMFAMGTHRRRNRYGFDAEGIRPLLELSLDLFRGLGDTLGEADCLLELAWLGWWREDFAESAALARESLALYTRVGHIAGMGWSLQAEGQAVSQLGDAARARTLFAEALDIAERLEARPMQAWASFHLGEAIAAEGRPHEAFDRFSVAAGLFEEVSDRWGATVAHGIWGTVARRSDDLATAVREYGTCLLGARSIDAEGSIVWMVESIAGLASQLGAFEQGARLRGAAERRRQERSLTRPVWDTDWYEEDRARLRDGLGAEALERLIEEGRSLAWADAVSLALEVCEAHG